MRSFKGKRVLITGACGTVGAELVSQLLGNKGYKIEELVGIDNNESALFFIDQQYLSDSRAIFFVADIRDKDELINKTKDIDIIFHSAALKHVVLCEKSPDQAVQTNIIGLQNVISAAEINNVEVVIFTSSDKAVNPTNVMGTSKLMGERLMTAANSNKRGNGPIFASTRFGNVLGSSGSVIPIFHNQIAKGGPVTLTDKDMTRFVMSVEQSVQLVLDSAQLAKGGEVFVTKMPVIRIEDLAVAMIELLASRYYKNIDDITIEQIGTKPGEKLYEELMSDEELRRTLELDNYFSVLPAFRGIYNDIDYAYSNVVSSSVSDPYTSELQDALSVDEVKDFLQKYKLLDAPEENFEQRYWPGDKK